MSKNSQADIAIFKAKMLAMSEEMKIPKESQEAMMALSLALVDYRASRGDVTGLFLAVIGRLAERDPQVALIAADMVHRASNS